MKNGVFWNVELYSFSVNRRFWDRFASIFSEENLPLVPRSQILLP
jgi:hypothetical protein